MSTDLNMEYQEVKFGDICREVKLTTKDPIADGYDKYIGLEHLDSGSLKIKRWGLIAEDSPKFTRIFKKGHILIGKRRPYLRKAAIAEFDGVCSGDIIVVEPFGNLKYSSILPYIISSEKFWECAIQTSMGSLSPRTKFSSLINLNIPILNQEELDSFLQKIRSIERVSSILDQVIQKNNQVMYLSLARSFSSLNFNAKLSDIINKLIPGKSVNSMSEPAEANSVGVLKVSALSAGKFIHTENKNVSDVKEKNKLSLSVEVNDLLLTRANTSALVGECALVLNAYPNLYLSDKIWKLDINTEKVEREWLKYLLIYLKNQGVFSEIATGTSASMKNISQEKMLNVDIYLPSKKRQKDVLNGLKRIEGIHEVLEDKALLFKKINGKIINQYIK
ncbi:restriction endonuclease subunit S [Acinetobacter pittii]|uniref:restriction endonuclease subunit S n=1 Tax=Acinetobacter pittii TaxID=48296 RepID=UPI00083A36D9|nr:restriction endonuclease subunit S [Acinetobacter pittii]OCZ70125.1 restriction endonuclease subunit S [Acinetobacter pittii]